MAHDTFLLMGNIERFEQRLKEPRNDADRKVVRELLAEQRRRH